LYRVVIGMETVAECGTFTEAFSKFSEKMIELMGGEGISSREADTCWIEIQMDPNPVPVPLRLENLATIGDELGWVKDGNPVEPLPATSDEQIQNAISRVLPEIAEALFEHQVEIARTFSRMESRNTP
jgi:hypothetical protein